MRRQHIVLFALCLVGSAASASPATTQRIVAATNAFLATLEPDEKAAVNFASTDTAQKQRWSNLPGGVFKRAGLRWADLDETERAAWLEVMKITLSQEGYRRVMDEWRADDALAASSGGGRAQFGAGFYYIALIGAPSESEPWQWQWGGHHVTINASVAGPNLSLTPSFIGVQPASYTSADGKTVRPLGDIERDAFVLLGALDQEQRRAAILGRTAIDVVLGPGEDGKTLAPQGLRADRMSADQRAALLRLIAHYTGLVNEEDGALRTAEVQSHLGDTYFAWSGPTDPGSAIYFRVTGPSLVIEYGAQGSGTPTHIHGIYRDPTNDYGSRYTR